MINIRFATWCHILSVGDIIVRQSPEGELTCVPAREPPEYDMSEVYDYIKEMMERLPGTE